MRAIDTNVLVRFLVADDAPQLALVRQLFADVSRRGEALHVTLLVLAELAWVLESGYGLGREDVLATLERLLETRELDIAQRDLVRGALGETMRGLGGFADCLIGRLGIAAGCEVTLTFDRGLDRNPAFERLG
jgi:predicted nucleic-acid-binding protein